MATVHAANVDLEFDLCGAERDHNAGRMCDPPDERVRRVEMGRIPKKGGNSVMLIMEEQSEDSESEVRIYLRKKREKGETKHDPSHWCCACNVGCLANYFNKLVMLACCFLCCFGFGLLLWFCAYYMGQNMEDPASWVATTGLVVNFNATAADTCIQELVWWRAMFNLAAVAETCCDLEITYNTSVVKKTNWAKFAYSNGDAATVCQSLNGKTQDVYYKDEDPDKLIMKQRYDSKVESYATKDEVLMALMIAGGAMMAIYALCAICCCCYCFTWLCGCLPERLQYYTTYGMRDFCGRDKQLEEQHDTEMENEGEPIIKHGDEYVLVNPDDTRESLKDSYEKAKAILIGKQLLCIQHSEELFTETEKWCARNRDKPKEDDKGANGREDGGPLYRELWKIVDQLRLAMTSQEQDPHHQVLEEFRKSFANHLVHEFDPTDKEKRLEATTLLCMSGNMKYEDAEMQIQKAFKLRAKALANDICSTIIDSQTKKIAIQKVAASGASWSQAARYVAEALEGQHKDKAALLDGRNYSIETVPLNRERRRRYIPLKEWWEANNLVVQSQIDGNPLLSSVLNNRGFAGKILPTSFVLDSLGSAFGNLQDIEDFRDFKARINVINHEYEELRVLMDEFLDVQTRWAVYLKLCNSAAHVDNDKNQRLLRQQVRKELHSALGELLVDMMTPDDKNELHKLLQEMENVDIQTDEYVHRLEDNLKEIAVAETEQCDDIKVQLESFQRINNRMDGVLKGIQENTDRVLRLVTVQTRIRNCGYFTMLLTACALGFILFEDQIFGT